MKTGLFSRVITSFALVGTAFAPMAPAYADSLQTEFDTAFAVPVAQPAAQAVPAATVLAPVRLQFQPQTQTQPQSQLLPQAQRMPQLTLQPRILPKPTPQLTLQPRILPRVTPQVQVAVVQPVRTAPAVRPYVSAPAVRAYGSGLEPQLYALADASGGRIGVAAIDLTSGRTVSVMGDTPFPMASTSKIAIAATFLDAAERGRLSLGGSYPLMVPVSSRKYSSQVAPVRAGVRMSGTALIERALINSDNQATDALLAAVGGPAAVNRWLRSTGLTGLRLDRDIATLVRDDGEFDPARTIDPRDSATPLGMAQLLSGIYQGRWLSGASRSFLLSTMERCQTGKRRMRSQLPEGIRIAHKTGTLSNTSSDVGLIRAPDGRVYAVAVYVTGQGGHAGRDAKIAQITRTVYDGYQMESGGYRVAAQR